MGKEASLKQVVRLIELVMESGWSREEFQRRIIERWGVLRDIAVALDDPQLSEEQVRAMHPLFYNKKASFSELLAACRQDWVHPDFIEKSFPLEPVTDDKDQWEVVQHSFHSMICGEVAFEEFKAMCPLGFRLCGPRRAMEFIAANPSLQAGHPLIITARGLNGGGHWCVPVFDWDDGERKVYLNSFMGDFGPRCVWLVLRRKVHYGENAK